MLTNRTSREALPSFSVHVCYGFLNVNVWNDKYWILAVYSIVCDSPSEILEVVSGYFFSGQWT